MHTAPQHPSLSLHHTAPLTVTTPHSTTHSRYTTQHHSQSLHHTAPLTVATPHNTPHCHYTTQHPSLSLHHTTPLTVTTLHNTPHSHYTTQHPSLSLHHTTPLYKTISHTPYSFGLRRCAQDIGFLGSYHVKSKWILQNVQTDTHTDQRMCKQVLHSVPHPRPAHLDWIFSIVCHVSNILSENYTCYISVLYERWR